MNTTQRNEIMQRWRVLQHKLLPELKQEVGSLTPKLQQQRGLPLEQLLESLPRQCDTGTKSNAQGYKNSWDGYKLHIDTADCGIPVSALLTSASMHDSLAAIPLSLMTAERVTNCYI